VGIYFRESVPGPRAGKEEWYLGIECSWRVEAAGWPIASSRDDNAPDGPMLRGLDALVGTAVSDAQLLAPALDLILELGPEARLSVFSDVVREDLCWYLLGPDDLDVSVEPAGVPRFKQGVPEFD
jgi:hypothetical protein